MTPASQCLIKCLGIDLHKDNKSFACLLVLANHVGDVFAHLRIADQSSMAPSPSLEQKSVAREVALFLGAVPFAGPLALAVGPSIALQCICHSSISL